SQARQASHCSASRSRPHGGGAGSLSHDPFLSSECLEIGFNRGWPEIDATRLRRRECLEIGFNRGGPEIDAARLGCRECLEVSFNRGSPERRACGSDTYRSPSELSSPATI